MALRISSAEIVSSAMSGVLFPAGSCLEWVPGRRSAGQPTSGDFESMSDAAVDDLVAHLDDQTADDARVHGHLQPDGPAVETAEHVGEALLLGRGQRDRRGHARRRLTTP